MNKVVQFGGEFDLEIGGTAYSDVRRVGGLRMSIAKLLQPLDPAMVRRGFRPGGFQFGNIAVGLHRTRSGLFDLEQWVTQVAGGNPFARDAELNLHLRGGQPGPTVMLDELIPVSFPQFAAGFGPQAQRQVLFAVGRFRIQ